ncbi:hypothetical protein SMICM304S_06752 [Streptomyces microflavus]
MSSPHSPRPGTRAWCSTRCCPRRTPVPRPPRSPGPTWSSGMSGTGRRWRARSPGWTRSATRRRWWGWARTSRTRRCTWGATTSVRRCCWRRWPPPGCGISYWPGRWSSTARAATTARATARSAPARARRPDCGRGASSPTAPTAVRSWCRAWSPRTRPPTRATCTRPPNSPRSTWPPRGRGPRGAGRCRCATTTCTGRGCRATPRTPGSPRSSARPWRAGRRPGSTRTGASAATSSTSAMSPRPTRWPWRRSGSAGPPPSPRTTRAAGSRTPSARWPPRWPPRTAGRSRW